LRDRHASVTATTHSRFIAGSNLDFAGPIFDKSYYSNADDHTNVPLDLRVRYAFSSSETPELPKLSDANRLPARYAILP
jgi:hypothetical protein